MNIRTSQASLAIRERILSTPEVVTRFSFGLIRKAHNHEPFSSDGVEELVSFDDHGVDGKSLLNEGTEKQLR